MKRPMFSVLTVIVLAGLTGCMTHPWRRPCSCTSGACAQAPANCQSCEAKCGACNGTACDNGNSDDCAAAKKHCCCLFGKRAPAAPPEAQAAEPGPATGAIAYPYYTTRGPRDFLAKNPQSIGP